MKSLAVANAHAGYILTVLNGVDKGATYQVGIGRITLGRDADNTIVIRDDPRVSRHHGVLIIGPSSCEIADVSDKNKIYVNGNHITNSFGLQPGAVIQLGNTKMKLTVPGYVDPIAPARRSGLSLGKNNGPRRRNLKKSSPMFYVILGLVLLGALYLASNSGDSNTEKKDIVKTNIEATIEESRNSLAKLESFQQKSGLSKRQYQEAQSHYIRGFRDYKKGQFDRARESFEACLAIHPTHPQCSTYKVLAQQKFAELIESYLNLGRKYQSQNQYGACKAALRNVLVLMKNRTSPIYKEAEINFKLCDALDGGPY